MVGEIDQYLHRVSHCSGLILSFRAHTQYTQRCILKKWSLIWPWRQTWNYSQTQPRNCHHTPVHMLTLCSLKPCVLSTCHEFAVFFWASTQKSVQASTGATLKKERVYKMFRHICVWWLPSSWSVCWKEVQCVPRNSWCCCTEKMAPHPKELWIGSTCAAGSPDTSTSLVPEGSSQRGACPNW